MTAVIESIVFMLQTNFELCVSAAGMPDHWVLSGGLSALNGLCQRLADISGVPVIRPDVDEATAYGVSNLLGIGSSLPASTNNESVFVPQTNANLESRYLRWQDAMADFIAVECC